MKKIFGKLLFIISGIFLALILIEASLRIAGFTILNYQQYKNEKALNNKSPYNVMCIGESITAGEYPRQLQQILDKSCPDKFSIFDCALGNASLDTILKDMDNNIEKYRPDIAVCAMGGVDTIYTYDINDTDFIQKHIGKIKILKLLGLIQEYFYSRNTIHENFLTKTGLVYPSDEILRQAVKFYNGGNYYKAKELLKEVLKINPNNEFAYLYLTIINFNDLHNEELAHEMAMKAFGMDFYDKDFYYLIIMTYIMQHGDLFQMRNYIDQIIEDPKKNISPLLYKIISNLTTFKQKKLLSQKMASSGKTTQIMTEKEKEKLLETIIANKTDKFYGAIAIHYIEQQNYEKADLCFNKAEQLRIKFPNEEKSKLYRLIIQKLIDNNTKVICMQYPVRSLKPLKNILKDTRYYDKVTFLSNEEIFKQALKEKPYDEIFVDQFGGDFGHCTDYGNTLIAENVAENLLKLIQ